MSNSKHFIDICKSIVYDQNQDPIDSGTPILATLDPICTNLGDTIKLDATVLINILTSGNGLPAANSSIIAIQRDTLAPGALVPTSTIIVAAQILDTNLNNPPTTTPLTRLATLNWVDTPPQGTSTYIFRVIGAAAFNVTGVAYTDRFLSATIFHNKLI